MDCPTDVTAPEYAQALKQRGVTDVVRVCIPMYDVAPFVSNAITVHDWPFPDGQTPPQQIIEKFLRLCKDRFGDLRTASVSTQLGPTIAVHCVAGLGRAPVMVGIALIESGMKKLDVVSFIRKQRRGALNSLQLCFLVDEYKKNKKRSNLFNLFNFFKNNINNEFVTE
jgi:protein tyrosine phosphatase type 4A